MMAFERFKQINELPEVTEKHKAWLEDYAGLNYSKAVDETHLMKWQKEPKKYNPQIWDPSINLIKERPDRLRIEFDGDDGKAKEYLEQTYQKLKEMGVGFIRSTHKGKCDYLWVEFTRGLKPSEKKLFLKWIAPQGSEVDLNFASDEKVFAVLYAQHWKHSYQRELPVRFHVGKKIDFDSLGIKPKQGLKSIKKYENFDYETFTIKEPSSYHDKPLEFWTYNKYLKLKEDKNFLVEKVIYPKTVNMIYSAPGEFKSLLCLGMALSISNGKPWLNFKTKKFPVLYCDKENNDQIIKTRLKMLHDGLNLKRNSFPLHILRRNGDLLDSGFIRKLTEAIKEFKIKVVFFDTLHRFADYDENKSDDINRIYTNVFQPLIDDLGCSIIFLHHAGKDGDYRGSGDFLGMVDTAYKVQRIKQGKIKTNFFRLLNEKSRAGEIEQVYGDIDFSEDESYIKFNRKLEQQEDEKKVNVLKFITEKIKSFAPEDRKFRKKDITDAFDMAEIEYSDPTVKRSLKFLVENGYFDFDKTKKVYWRLIK